MKTNNSFNIVPHKGIKSILRDGAAAEKQAKTGHIAMEHSMYSVLSDSKDDYNEAFDEDEAFIHPPMDDKIEDKGTQTNKAKGKVMPTGEMGAVKSNRAQKRVITTREIMPTSTCAGEMMMTIAPRKAKIEARKRKGKSLQRVRNSTP